MMLSRNARIDAALAAAGMTVLVAVRQMTGRIPVNDGRGWDGMDYAAMLTSGFDPARPIAPCGRSWCC